MSRVPALICAILIFKLCAVSGFGPLAGPGFAEDDYPTERQFVFFSFPLQCFSHGSRGDSDRRVSAYPNGPH
jgi:hypothetical protein